MGIGKSEQGRSQRFSNLKRKHSMIKRINRFLASTFDARDVILGVGLCMMSAGLFFVWSPAALIVPGTILTFVAIRGGVASGGAEVE